MLDNACFRFYCFCCSEQLPLCKKGGVLNVAWSAVWVVRLIIGVAVWLLMLAEAGERDREATLHRWQQRGKVGAQVG